MCTRYVSPEDRDMEYTWSLVREPFTRDSVDVRVTTEVPIIYQSEEGRVCDGMRWGLIPSWFKNDKWKAATFNARSETMTEKPSFRTAWKRGQRCLFPIRGFYEWQDVGEKTKQRWFIRLTESPMAIAGLWDDDPKHGRSAVMITLPANSLMQDIHNSGGNKHRMPLFIEPDNVEAWLRSDPEPARDLVVPIESEQMEAWKVPSNVSPDDIRNP